MTNFEISWMKCGLSNNGDCSSDTSRQQHTGWNGVNSWMVRYVVFKLMAWYRRPSKGVLWSQVLSSMRSVCAVSLLVIRVVPRALRSPDHTTTNALNSGSAGDDDSMIILQRICRIPMNCQCEWLSASLTARETFFESCPSPEKFLFCTDKIESIEEQDLEQRQRARWLFRDSPTSLRTLWSVVIKSPNFSARGTALPVRLLQGVLVILVRVGVTVGVKPSLCRRSSQCDRS